MSDRRKFLQTTGLAAAGAILGSPFAEGRTNLEKPAKKRTIAMVGTGIRGSTMWGKSVQADYGDYISFVGLCDINPGRVETVKKYIGCNCPTFTDFEKMMREVKPEILIVTTVDATHHEFIIRGMELGADIITEKPMTTDEVKCQAILDAEKRTGKKVTVTFNYRYSPHRQKLYEMLRSGAIGDIVSCDFHWYLDVYHGADYFRRWHGYREKGGTLFVHKATHHYDLLNWWLESEPTEVYAYGALDFYGKNNSFRGTNCRTCPHKEQCKFHWNMGEQLTALYADNEKYDGYMRDGCVWREDIDIYDKMTAQIKYANNVIVSYSLTTYSPYEGYRIAFNGTKGRLEAWIKERQPWEEQPFDEIRLTTNFGETELIQISNAEGGHGGGDQRMKDKIFVNTNAPDPYRQSAGTREGAMSCLIGIAARKSVEQQKPIKIADLTSLQPMAKRP